jgi:septal ring factor EnvC (AmiA/AmiB activator)
VNALAAALIFTGLLATWSAHADELRQAPDSALTNGVPASQAGKLPTTEQRYRTLQQQVQHTKPAVQTAKQKSDTLAAQAAHLRQQLIATAAHVQELEGEKGQIDSEVASLAQQEHSMSAVFARDRVKVSHLLAVLERLQSDLPPAIALEPADALGSTRGAMVLGASLPRIYGAAAALAKELDHLKETRGALLSRRQDGIRTAAKLTAARAQLDQLLATKEAQASGANTAYRALQSKFNVIAGQASDLKVLLDRVAQLRKGIANSRMVIVSAQEKAAANRLKPGSLLQPVMGTMASNDIASGQRIAGLGLNFWTGAGASVVAPADSQVLFAGPYHKTGQVLILETSGGYDLVLAGLDRIDVRPGDDVLAGEPVGTMPRGKNGATLYFELRQNGKSVNPAPWLGVDLRKAKRT